MNLLRYIGALAGIAVVSVPLVVSASPVLRSGDTVVIEETQAVGGDFYAGAGSVMIAGSIAGDLYALGATVSVDGDVSEDVSVLGGVVHVRGSVGDDVRIVAGEVVISDTVDGDVVVLSGVLRVLETARISGDVLFFGGEVDMDGMVAGSFSGRTEAARINGSVGGDVQVQAIRSLQLGDEAVITGSIEYVSSKEIIRAPNSIVEGDVVRSERTVTDDVSSVNVLAMLMLLFTTLVYYLFFRKRLELYLAHHVVPSVRTLAMRGLVGIGAMLVLPIVISILIVSMIGVPIGVTLLLVYILGLLTAWSFTGIAVGVLLARYFDGTVAVTLKWTLVGTAALAIVLNIPVLGFLVFAVITLTIFGGMIIAAYRYVRG